MKHLLMSSNSSLQQNDKLIMRNKNHKLTHTNSMLDSMQQLSSSTSPSTPTDTSAPTIKDEDLFGLSLIQQQQQQQHSKSKSLVNRSRSEDSTHNESDLSRMRNTKVSTSSSADLRTDSNTDKLESEAGLLSNN